MPFDWTGLVVAVVAFVLGLVTMFIQQKFSKRLVKKKTKASLKFEMNLNWARLTSSNIPIELQDEKLKEIIKSGDIIYLKDYENEILMYSRELNNHKELNPKVSMNTFEKHFKILYTTLRICVMD
ncbi:MAG: hypothetical protein ACTSPO_15770 [Candidatus Heimdallarchaeaceae archaeon]